MMPKRVSEPGARKLIRVSATTARRLRRIFDREVIYVSNAPFSVVPFMFLRKAFHVHDAVMVLCRAGMGSEAYALSRIMVEMSITLRWITNRDQNTRAKQYGFFVTKRKEYWAKILQEFYPTDSGSAEALKYVDNLYGRYAANYKSSIFWSSENLKTMAEETEQLETNSPVKTAVWDYKIPYSMTSDHVHATVAALDDLAPVPGTAYKFSPVRSEKLTANAAYTATSWLLKIAGRVGRARKLGLDSAIAKVQRPFEELVTERKAVPKRRKNKSVAGMWPKPQ